MIVDTFAKAQIKIEVVQEFLSIFERTGISNNFCKQNGSKSIIIIDKNKT